jgi:hypothetical protein
MAGLRVTHGDRLRILTPWLLSAAALAAGALAALHYHMHGLSLSHFDARAHLVVARRILDSLTPGWQQIGAVWLPLPHVLNMLPVQIDAWYRTGASGIALSVASMALACGALAALLMRLTGSALAGAAGALLLLGNPNVLYLQSAPMTEPLLIGAALVAVTLTAHWLDRDATAPPRAAGWALIAACMTRYEAWPVAVALVGLAGGVLLWRGATMREACRACARLGTYPAVAILLFSANSRWTTGRWFVSTDFYVPENVARGRMIDALRQVGESVQLLSGPAVVWAASAAAVLIVAVALRSRDRTSLLLLLSLVAAAAIPAVAYYHGHPVRIRYGVPLVAACAALIAGGIALLQAPLRPIAAAAIVVAALVQSPPLDPGAPIIAESRRDDANREGRRAVTRYLAEHWDGTPIMMSMGSLAHYMHDLMEIDLRIRNFLHEGNENLWQMASRLGPRGFVRWVAIEERAGGGDRLSQRARDDPAFLDGFERVAEGGGVVLYRLR